MTDQTKIVLAVLAIAWSIALGLIAAVLLGIDPGDQAWSVLGGVALAGVSGALGWVSRGATVTPPLADLPPVWVAPAVEVPKP
jgi:hypothetical protein